MDFRICKLYSKYNFHNNCILHYYMIIEILMGIFGLLHHNFFKAYSFHEDKT